LLGLSVCAVAILSCAGCGNPYTDKVIGTWETKEPFDWTLTIQKDGTGTQKVSIAGKTVTKNMTWRLNGNNLIFKMDGKETGALIKSIDENKMHTNDPAAKMDVIFTRVK